MLQLPVLPRFCHTIKVFQPPSPVSSSARDPLVRIYRPKPVEAAIRLDELLRQESQAERSAPVTEIGGRKDGPEPTRYGDWEKNGRCIDF